MSLDDLPAHSWSLTGECEQCSDKVGHCFLSVRVCVWMGVCVWVCVCSVV